MNVITLFITYFDFRRNFNSTQQILEKIRICYENIVHIVVWNNRKWAPIPSVKYQWNI